VRNASEMKCHQGVKSPVDVPIGYKFSVDVAWVDIPSRHLPSVL
jgi:hypothetical protein